MRTRTIKWDKAKGYDIVELREAARILRFGGLVAFPTETVYGLGCDGRSGKAAKLVYEAKGRPGDNPLILHIANKEQLKPLVKEIPPMAEKLMDTFWPGPLTMIFIKSDKVPPEITGGLNTVAVRMPAHAGARELILAADIPIAAPSANTSGKPSPTMAEHVADDLAGKIDMIIDGGEVGIGYESTILDMTTSVPVILRPGFITREMIEEVIGQPGGEPIAESTYTYNDNEESPTRFSRALRVAKAYTNVHDRALRRSDSNSAPPKAPGMKYRHYAPEANLTVVRGDEAEVEKKINELIRQFPSDRVGVLTTDERMGLYDYGIVLSIGSTRDNTLGQKMYSSLRQFDLGGVQRIYAETFFGNEHEDALMNRLMKAAGGQVIDLADYHKLIFVCRENVTISPMAEWIMKSIVMNKSVEICSRGLVVLFSEPVNQKVMELLGTHSVPCEEQFSRELRVEDIDEHTLVITMTFTEKVKVVEDFKLTEHVYTLREFVGYEDDVMDPYGGDEAAYEALYSELKDLLYKMKKRLGLD